MAKEDRNEFRPNPPMRGPGGPGGPIRVTGEKAKNFKETMAKFFAAIGNYKWKLLLVVIFAVVSCVFTIIAPKILGEAINIVAEGSISLISSGVGMDYTALAETLVILLSLYALSTVSSFLQNFIVAGVATGISYEFRQKISEKINKLPLNYFDKVSHGDILSRITNDVDTINQSLNQSLSQIITSVISIIGVMIMMLSISPVMTMIAFVVMLVTPVTAGQVIKRSQKFFRNQQEYLGKVNGKVEESYSGHLIVKAFDAQDNIIEEYNKLNDELYNSAWKSQFLSSIMMPLTNFIGNLAYVGVCIVGSFMVLTGRMKIGNITSFIQYMRSFTQPISQIAQISNVLQSTAAAAERVFEFLDEAEEEDETGKALFSEEIQGEVVFERVSFGYDPEVKIIKDFSAKIKPGQVVAIVGPTGAGKTTIVKLLMRFYELNSGAVYIDGRNIADVTRDSLRDSLGMVLQDTWLFSGSIKENIRFSNKTATDEEIIAAAKDANVHRFIKTLPGGYDYCIDEESSNISQGQKQLLTIARAFLSNPKILILDEATSSVDTRTELVIQKAMKNLMKGKTSFVIAHRLSTIRDADLILVMNEGDIVEAGNHEELLEKGGFYADLYNSQFDDFDEK